MKTLVITSNCLRHLAFLSRIKKEIDITHAILVSKLSGIDEFRRAEMKYFGDVWLPLLSKGHPTYCAPKDLHSPEMAGMFYFRVKPGAYQRMTVLKIFL
jgi:hypothetical protein